jgi:hypothetical protein
MAALNFFEDTQADTDPATPLKAGRFGASLSPDTAMRPYRRSSSAHRGDWV